MDVISSFGGTSLPEDSVIDRLLDIAFPLEERSSKSKQLAFIHDEVPSFHLFLLRLMLLHRYVNYMHFF